VHRYVKRRAGEQFRQHAGEIDAGAAQQLIASAKEQLQLVQRQAIVYTLFARKNKSIMVCSLMHSSSQCRHLARSRSRLSAKHMMRLKHQRLECCLYTYDTRLCVAGFAGMEGG